MADSSSASTPCDPTDASLLRRALRALVLFGTTGLFAELVLLEHWHDSTQAIPLALLAMALAVTGLHVVSPTRRSAWLFQRVMGALVIVGALGVILHLRGNFEFEREILSDRAQGSILLRALQGATPTLAPGALLQLGLLGWIADADLRRFIFRSPSSR